MLARRLLLEPNNPNVEGGGGNTPAPVAPYKIKETSDKTPAGLKSGKLPEESKKFEFKVDPSLLQSDNQVDVPKEVVDIPAKSTPLDVANKLLEKDKPASEIQKAEPTDKPVVQKVEAEQVQKVEDKPVQAHKSEEIRPIVPKSKEAPKEFDYTGHDEQETYILKNMSVEARKHVSKLMKENKELAANKSGTYMQHPDAYVLDPQFSKLNEDVSFLEREAAHWESQLLKIENGEKWNPLQGFDKNGQPVYGAAQDPTTTDKIKISRFLNDISSQYRNKQTELQQFAGNYKSRIQQDSQAIQQERARRFGWVADPTIMKSTLTLPNGQEQTVEQVRNAIINLFPPYMRNTLGVEVAADLFAAFQIQDEELRTLRAGKSVAQVQQKEVARAEPTSHKSNAEDTSKKVIGGIKEFSIKGMPV